MKVTSTKSKNSESFYIVQSYINNEGKSTSRVYEKLGTLKELSERLNVDRDGVLAWARARAKQLTAEYDKENETVMIPFSPNTLVQPNKQNSVNVGYLFLQDILSKLRVDNIFRNIKAKHKYEYHLESIFSDLVFARILNPCSKHSSYAYAQGFLEPPKYAHHDMYRGLSVLAEEFDYIQAELYRNSNFIHSRNTKVLYYDCTNFFFEINEEDEYKRYGKSKENRPNPIIQMGLFMDGDGIPLAFNLYPGNQNEQITLKPLEEKIIKDFGVDEFVFCSDAGLASKANKKLNSSSKRSYVITQSLKKLNKEDRAIALNPSQYRKIGHKGFIDLDTLDENNEEDFNAVYYKEIPILRNGVSEVIIVTYSPKYRAYQAGIRDGQIERAQKIIDNNSKHKRNRRNPNDPQRFIKKTSVTETGEVADKEFLLLDEDVIKNESQYDGFYAVSTDMECDIQEIININKQRWQIEECFRIMKTEFKSRPVYVSREDRIKAHFLICFSALLVYRLLDIKLESKYTVDQLIKTLRTMNMTSVSDAGYIPAFTRTDITDSLHDTFNFRLDNQITRRSRIRSIIKQTK